MGNYHSKLNQTERMQLARWKAEGVSNKECARRLRRHPSTIGRELKRNAWERIYYEPLHAQSNFQKRKEKAWQVKHPLKNKDIYAYVMDKLKEGWSPEQISGRLKVEHPDDPHWRICHETIYRYIYHPNNKNKYLYEYLRRKQKKRKKRAGRSVQRVRIPDRVSIHQRPAYITNRTKIGHWEGDTLIGKGRANGLHTAYERYTSVIRMERMNSITADESLRAQKKIYADLPPDLRRSVTLDNGSEHVKHAELKRDLGMNTYFADPYAAWQRGGNENANMWIRYYFPKGTDFATIVDEEITDVEWELNNRPRKRLGFKTPLEVLIEHLPKGCNRR